MNTSAENSSSWTNDVTTTTEMMEKEVDALMHGLRITVGVLMGVAIMSIMINSGEYPGWNCLNFLHVFVGYQANFPWFNKILKEMSMH